MVCSIGRARVGQDDNVKRAIENVQQRVALIRDGFPRSCAHLRDAQLYRSAFERRSTADTRLRGNELPSTSRVLSRTQANLPISCISLSQRSGQVLSGLRTRLVRITLTCSQSDRCFLRMSISTSSVVSRVDWKACA